MSTTKVRRVQPDEELARAYLLNRVNRRFKSVEPHPCGEHRPPDLLADGKVAVEVTRVVQRSRMDPKTGRAKSLEETRIPLLANLRNLLKRLGPPAFGAWNVTPIFRAPLPKGETLRATMKAKLEAFLQSPAEKSLRISRNLTLEFSRAPVARRRALIVSGTLDRDAGGATGAKMHESLTYSVNEKTRKAADSRHRHPEWKWWLVLVDRTGLGMTEADFEEMRADMRPIEHDWDNVILLDPKAHRRDLEL